MNSRDCNAGVTVGLRAENSISRRVGSQSASFWAVVVAVVVFAVHLVVVMIIRENGWDDGSITAAFARTFARYGRIALTPQSEEVEGFSSPAWFLLLSAGCSLGSCGFEQNIRTGQILAALFASTGASIAFLTLRRLVGAAAAGTLAVAIFICSPFLNETMNGMEMSLLAAIITGIAFAISGTWKYRFWFLVALSFAASLVRFEAVLYLGGAAVVAWLLSRRSRDSLAILIGSGTAFAAVTAFRAVYFEALVPNSIAAKQWAPYSGGGVIRSRVSAGLEPLIPIILSLLALLVLVYFQRSKVDWHSVRPTALGASAIFGLAYVSVVFVFNVAIGRNWGYTGRMQLSGLPMLVLGGVTAAYVAGLRCSLRAVRVWAVALIVGSMITLQWINVKYAVMPNEVNSTRPQVTPAYYRATGEAVDGIRRKLNMKTISFMTPDVGGSSLCCAELQIIDLGLLANARLTAEGYKDFDMYLSDIRPDVIEVHGVWAEVSGIYRSATFLNSYEPVVADNTWLWVRRDHLAYLDGEMRAGVDLSTLRYRGDPVDETFLQALNPTALYLTS
jgi:hypothetical protein